MSEPKSGFQFDFEWRIALFTALLVPFLAIASGRGKERNGGRF